MHDHFTPYSALISTKLAYAMRAEKAESMIDIGCGSGEFSLWCLKNLKNLKKLVSVDVFEESLVLAKELKE